MSSPVAIVWDLDGVLLDTEPIYLGVEHEIAVEHGANPEQTKSLLPKVLGRSGLVSARIIVAELGLSVKPEKFLAARDTKLADAFNHVQLCKGALQLVRHFKHLGLLCAIATSSCAELLAVKRKAQPALFAEMSAVICADDVVEAKPAPLLFLEAARRLGVAPEKCLVFEDAPAGILAANRAGMRSIALRNQEVDASEYKQAGGDNVHVILSGSLLQFDCTLVGLPNMVQRGECPQAEILAK